ncbi:hypothetical protein [Streptomyces zhihengii]
MSLRLITATSDDPTAETLAAAEDNVRAGIVHDFWTAKDRGDRLAALQAEFMARQVDASTPTGPRLLDELAPRPVAA